LRIGNDGILLFPPHPETAVKKNATLFKFKNCAYTGIFNALQVAITQVPLGLSNEGLPIGVQVIAGPFNDHLTIAVAEELEKRFGGWVPSSRILC
jgi:fatty acid amide hydrolase 2